ncbi:MAG: hypothetical protein ACPG49_13425 [Chitinophagales bacterium]
MKKISVLIFAAMLLTIGMTTNNLQAQDAVSTDESSDMMEVNVNTEVAHQKPEMETLLNQKTSFGGFLAFSAKVADINGQAGVLTGGQLAMVLNHSLNIGLAGYGLATNVNANYMDVSGKDYFFEMGYGGLLIEPVIGTNKLVHISVPIILGGGWAGVTDERFYEVGFDYDHDVVESDVFWVVEPSVNVEVNIWKIARIGFGMGYRYLGDTNFENTTDADMSGLSGNITFKLGWF